jgi:subtilase family serine protease
MRTRLSTPRLLFWATLCALAATVIGCSGLATVPGTSAAPQQQGQNFVGSGYLAQQVAEGNFVQACPELTFGQARCMAWGLRNVAVAPLSRTADGTKINGYGPSELQAAYGLTDIAKSGQGGTVAIVDAYGYPTLEKDNAFYRKTFGLPACPSSSGCLRILNQNGQTSPLPSPPPASNVGWLAEQALDVSMVSANCPNCHIIMIEAATNLYTAELAAASLHPNAISNSWGGGEYKGEKRGQFRIFYHPDIAITASSGDGGYGVIFPSSASVVTAVGGTSLKTADNTRGYTESAWAGSGSGCSKYIAAPPWQAVIEQRLGGCRNRITADVAYDANPSTGVAVYESYENDEEPPGWQVWGGTSVGSPAIAAIYALSQDTQAIPAAIAYAEKRHLHNITTGSNGTCKKAYLCQAKKGYNGPTGYGTPNGIKAF